MKSKQQQINERSQLLKLDPKSIEHLTTNTGLDLFEKLIPGINCSILTEEMGDNKEVESYLFEIGDKEMTIPVYDIKSESDVYAAVKRIESGLFL